MDKQKQIANFLKYLSLHGVSSKSLKYYKSDLVNFLTWAGSKKINQNLISEYINSIRLITPISTLKRRQSTLNSYANFMGFKKVSSRWKEGTFIHKLLYSRPNWYKIYHTYPLATYIHIAILVLFTSITGYAVYDQVFNPQSNLLAFPSALTRPNRFLSFQGRLTSNVGNPITTATNLVFKLHDAASAGSELWTSGTCSITPDQDGIFSTLLGSSCGSEIAATVFSENAGVWVGVTVAADAEATPRIQIATVAYALNSETLQGYPAGTGTSTIPYIASTGTLVLANASPKIQSTSGTFAVEGLAMTISTPNTSNGVITINPDGTGTLDLTFEGAAAGLSANGFLNATNANITSGALYGGTVASAATGYNFIDFRSGVSPTSKFSVNAVGNVTLAGDLTVTGDDLFMATNTAGMLLVADGTNFNPTAMSGDITISGAGATTIGADKILESHLKAVDAAGDEECLTYEVTTGDFEWQTCAAITPDSLDFIDFEDTLDLDAALTLNQTTYDWTQNYTGTTGTGLTYNANSLTTGTGISLASTSTAGGASGTSKVLNIARSGANAELAHTAYGVYSAVTNTNATSGTNIAGYFSASGATTANYGLLVAAGYVGIGVSDPDTSLEIFNAGNQLKLSFDATDNATFGVDTNGDITIDASGTKTIIADDLQVSGGDILDSNGNESIRFGTTASAINEATLTNAATGGTVTFAATGGDTNIPFSIDAKGSSALNLNSTGTGDILIGGGAGSTGCTVANATGTLTCTVGITASAIPFSGITSATNTIAAMVVGAGASLNYTSTGTINASSLVGATWIAPGTIGSSTPSTGAFTTLTASTSVSSLVFQGISAATTFGNASYGTTVAGSGLTISPTAWTATPTVSGLTTMTSGFDSNSASTVTNNSLTTGNVLSLTSTSTTGGASGTSKVLNIARSGANAQLAHTAYGVYSAVTNTNVTSGTNIAGYFSASGATTANYGLIVENGYVGIGTTAPTTALQIGTNAETHALDTGDVLISSDLEIDGILYLDGGTIANSLGNVSLILSSAPTTTANTLTNSSWLIENTGNLGQAALMVNQTKGGDLFTASASGTPMFTITNAGNVSLGNTAAQKFWIENTASGTVGRALTVAAGGTVAGGTDILGGNLILQSGLGTGTGASTISFQTGTTLGTGTTLQTMSTKMTILGNGNIGIGTTSPNAHLQINNSAPLFKIIRSGSGGASSYGGVILDVAGTANNTERLSFGVVHQGTPENNIIMSLVGNLGDGSGGNVGIGTTSPGGLLHLASTGDALSIIDADTDNSGEEDNPRLELRQDGQAVIGGLGFVGSAGQIYTGSLANTMYLVNDYNGSLQLGTNNTANVTILNSGNIGIGTTAPIAKLGVGTAFTLSSMSTLFQANSGTLGSTANNELALGSFGYLTGNQAALGIRAYRVSNGSDWTTSAIGLGMDVDNTVRAGASLWLNANGNVGIGTVSPGAKLDIYGNNVSISGMRILSGGSDKYAIAQFGRTTGDGTIGVVPAADNWVAGTVAGDVFLRTESTNKLFLSSGGNQSLVISGGNVGIGTTAPGYKLTVNASNPGCNGCTAWTNYSDSRLKENIVNLSGNVLDKIMELKPVTFNYNDAYYSQTGYTRPDGTTPTFSGFIAQDLQQIFPEMVSTAGSGYLDANLSNLQLYLVKGIQQQQGQITSLSGQLATLLQGACVTGNTMLPIRRKKKRKNGDNEEDEFDEFLCRIDDILPDDEVLSLNETTGGLNYAKINKLMDMGIQEVYELVTKSGKVIRTTAKHPYLTLIVKINI